MAPRPPALKRGDGRRGGEGREGVKRKECTGETDWNVPRRDRERETEEKKEKEKRRKLFKGMVVVSSHRWNVLRCDDSTALKPSVVKQRKSLPAEWSGFPSLSF